MSRDTTDNARSFSIFFLKRYHKLTPECHFYHNNIIWSRHGEEVARIGYSISTITDDSFIQLSYRVRRWGEEEWRPIDQKIGLERIPCHFGGYRWYFRCGLVKDGNYCGGRVAILYSVGDYFGCRHCADLSYDSCNQSKKMRGFPWKILTDEWKADEIYQNLRVTHYKGKPTRKYRRCLKLWSHDYKGTNLEEALQEEL
jgi:hypothetical protein